MQLTKKEKRVIIDTISKKIDGKVKIFLYGSRTRNIKNIDSDIDILILTNKPIPNQLIREIKIEISDALGGTKIDIVNSRFDNKTAFVQLIEETAILLWERT
ncbi:MAG: nucleotidyltransferase domain-containing protein [Ignavibacteria bacterium]|nr:nucleotidyltransferase domain-containing protein [Ignavibacteria bacterium]